MPLPPSLHEYMHIIVHVHTYRGESKSTNAPKYFRILRKYEKSILIFTYHKKIIGLLSITWVNRSLPPEYGLQRYSCLEILTAPKLKIFQEFAFFPRLLYSSPKRVFFLSISWTIMPAQSNVFVQITTDIVISTGFNSNPH